MSESENTDQELVSRLRVIEAQPLAARSEAFAALHDELSNRLGAGPAAPTDPRPG